jgi:hypothetical protein
MGEPGVADQTRYLELRLAECRHRPELHSHLIAAYEHNLRALKASPSLGAYLAYTDDLFEVCRAEWLDWRYNNARIYASLDDIAKTRAAVLQYEAGLAATGHADFVAKVSETHIEAIGHEVNSQEAEATLALLVIALLDWHVETNTAIRPVLLDKVRMMWATLRVSDPAVDWQRVRAHPPYHDRLPFSDGALDTIGGWLREAIPDNAGAAETTDPDLAQLVATIAEHASAYAERLAGDIGDVPACDTLNPVRPASDATIGHRATYAAIGPDTADRQRTRATYERIFELEESASSSTQLACDLADHDLYTELARAAALDDAHAALRRFEDTTELHEEHHYRALIAALDGSRSPIEVLFETTRASALQHAETLWNNVFLAYVTVCLRAVATYERAPIDMFAERVGRASKVVADVFGCTWDQLLEVPRVADYFARVLFVAGQRADISDVVAAGRVNLALVEPFQSAARAAADARLKATLDAADEVPIDIRALVKRFMQEPRFAFPSEMQARLTELYHQACPNPPSTTENARVVYWRAEVELDELIETVAAPPRPPTVLD